MQKISTSSTRLAALVAGLLSVAGNSVSAAVVPDAAPPVGIPPVVAVTETVVTTETVTTTNTPATKSPATKSPATKSPKAKSTKPKTTRVRGLANARILHAIPNAPAVDVYVDSKKVLTAAAYKSVSDYLEISSGKHAIKVTATGKNDALLSGDVSLSKGKFFTIAAYGTAEKPLLLRINETTGKIAEGKARVFVVHLAQAPAVDVTSVSTRTKAGYASFLKAVAPGKSRAKTAAIGDVKLQVRADGKVVKEADAKIEAGKRYAVFAVGDAQNLDLIVKPAAPNYVEPIVVPKPPKAKTPAAAAATTPKS